MESTQLEALRYPIGRFTPPSVYTPVQIQNWIEEIAALPAQLRAAVAGMTDRQLDMPYRPKGWTVRQVVHHVADSHLNSYIRFKWTLTEDTPTIKAYDEKKWAELAEAKSAPIDLSLDLLTTLHRRWVIMLQNLSVEELDRHYVHPETRKEVTLAKNIALYAWHGKHHVAHIIALKQQLAQEK